MDRTPKINFNGRGGGADGWTENGITLFWEFKVEKPGSYQIDIVTTETGSHGSPVWQGDHEVRLSLNGKDMPTKIVADSKEINPHNLYWKKIHTNGDVIAFDKPGVYQLTMVAEKVSAEKSAGFTFREINLLPVK